MKAKLKWTSPLILMPFLSLIIFGFVFIMLDYFQWNLSLQKLICGMFLLATIVLCALMLPLPSRPYLKRIRNLIEVGKHTSAQVISFNWSASWWEATVKYVVDAKEYVVTTDVSKHGLIMNWTTKRMREGREVQIFYNPSDPKDMIIYEAISGTFSIIK